MTVLTDKGIDDARLTCVRTTDNGKTGSAVLKVIDLVSLQLRQHEVQQVTRTAACRCTDTIGVTQSELVELILPVEVLAIVCLVSYQDDRELGTAENLSHVHVQVGQSVLDVHQEQYQVGFLSSDNDLLTNLLFEDIVTVNHPAPCVYHRELTTVPLALAILAVTGGTCLVAHDGTTGIGQSVK